MMKNSVFVVFCLMLTFVFSMSYALMRYKFSGVDEMQLRVAYLQKKVEKEELKSQLAENQLQEYQQQVAVLIPDAQKKAHDEKSAYQLRVLASVVATPDGDRLQIERASGIFEHAKQAFRDGKYEKAEAAFKEIIQKYPESVHIPEAHFLLVESQYQLKEFEVCIDTVEAMVTLFPESELTGFALLRLAKIYEQQDRLEDAVELYRTVASSYQDQQLVMQATSSLKAVEL
jgi:TolA-binding protein